MSDEPSQPQPEPIAAGRAVIIGQLVVNLPVTIILLGTFLVARPALDLAPLLLVMAVAVAVAWLWWSLSVPRWRMWAIGRGADPSDIQRIGEQTGLVWPEGSFFSKTEIRPRR